MSGRRDLLITVNSPGEVATWLRPTVAALRARSDSIRITVLITPCVYASGTEEAVVRGIPGVDQVLIPRESIRFALFGKAPAHMRLGDGAAAPAAKGALLHLGGEFLLSARMARRLRFPAFAYTEGFVGSPGTFTRLFVPYAHSMERAIGRGADRAQIDIVGNLMVDAAKPPDAPRSREEARRAIGFDAAAGERVVALFPGSRPYELLQVTKLLMGAAALVEQRARGVRFIVVLSPFVDERVVQEALARATEKPEQLTFWRGQSIVAMAAADLALAIPGSSTAELGAWGVPTVVCIPLDRPEEIPLDGIAGYVDRMPLFGKRLKRSLVLKAAQKNRFVSLPNRIADEMLLPELKSEALTPAEIAEAALQLLADDERRMRLSKRLIEVMGPTGAAATIAERLIDSLQADIVSGGGV